ncbi:MAG: hypothetical protein ACTTKL_02395 [Treponema sp.]
MSRQFFYSTLNPKRQESNKAAGEIPNNEIALQHVFFAYEDVQVLHDISLVFPEKTKTAIVGHSLCRR